MPDQFFIDQYRKKAALADPLGQAGRGKEFHTLGFLHVVRETIKLLDLRHEHDVLDVGCANGLLDIALSACCRSVLAVEPVDELVAHARKNLADCSNVRVEAGHGAAIPASDDSFDRALALEVIQLVALDELRKVFRELRRVMRPGGRILFGAIPDARHRKEFLGSYLEGVRSAPHLSQDQKAEIIAKNEKASWYDPAELIACWKELGCHAKVQHPSPSFPNADHRFHLIVSVEK